jgi:hypothetical protein
MKKLAACLLAVSLLLCACSPGSLSTADSEAAVAAFHQQYDASGFDAIYAGSAPELKAATSSEKFVKLLSVMHTRLGTVQSSSKASWRVFAGTSGNFIDLTYKTTYQHGEGVESFRFRTDRGNPQLVGYNINSTELITNDNTASRSGGSIGAILAG